MFLCEGVTAHTCGWELTCIYVVSGVRCGDRAQGLSEAGRQGWPAAFLKVVVQREGCSSESAVGWGLGQTLANRAYGAPVAAGLCLRTDFRTLCKTFILMA